jgi:hypothetical protein
MSTSISGAVAWENINTSLRPAGPPQASLGDLRHLQLPTKHGEHSLCVSEGVMKMKTRLARVAAGTVRTEPKARPQQEQFVLCETLCIKACKK